jgi:RHS repeat-associated protein
LSKVLIKIVGGVSWGQDTGTTGTQASTNPWTYAGGYNDTTSNRIKFGARYYHPARGRFTQPDPSGQSTNRYAYTACNPVNSTDPTGLLDQTSCGFVVLLRSQEGFWPGVMLALLGLLLSTSTFFRYRKRFLP